MFLIQHITKGVHTFVERMYLIAGVAIVAMMLITCLDVLLRMFRRPIPGTYEVVCYLAALAVSFAMAHTLVNNGHVAVNLVVRLLPKRFRLSIAFVTTSMSAILFSLLSWQSALFALDLRRLHEVSLTLEIPFYPFILGVAFSSAAVVLVLITNLLAIVFNGDL